MTRYIDLKTKCEMIPGIHDLSRALEFPDGHEVFKPLPEGKCIQWADEIPTIETIAVAPSAIAEAVRLQRTDRLKNEYSNAMEQLTRFIDQTDDNPAALAFYKEQCLTWHAWADDLCDLPMQPGFPWPDGIVPWPDQPLKPVEYK